MKIRERDSVWSFVRSLDHIPAQNRGQKETDRTEKLAEMHRPKIRYRHSNSLALFQSTSFIFLQCMGHTVLLFNCFVKKLANALGSLWPTPWIPSAYLHNSLRRFNSTCNFDRYTAIFVNLLPQKQNLSTVAPGSFAASAPGAIAVPDTHELKLKLRAKQERTTKKNNNTSRKSRRQ